MVQNKGLIFKQVPKAEPVPGEHLTIEDRPFDPSAAPPAGGITTRNHYFSFDPYQRGRMREASIKSYAPPYQLGKPVSNASVSTVLKSDTDRFAEGDVIIGGPTTPIEEYSRLGPDHLTMARKLKGKDENNNPFGLDPKMFLGPLGMPGLTAWSSFYEIGAPKSGETIFISAASGAVGQIVGQLAKVEGLTVIGSVGDDEKLKFIVEELGFDGGFNYKKEKPADALKRLAPDGIDIYYENVGGEQLEAALDAMKNFGRIVACGMISQYNLPPADRYPIRELMHIVAKRLKFQGFIVSDPGFGSKYFKDHQEKLQKWIADGKFKVKLSVTDGIDDAADGFVGMLKGKNFGKAVLQVAPLDS